MNEEKTTARTDTDNAILVWNPKTKTYRAKKKPKPPKIKRQTNQEIEEKATPNGSPIKLIRNIVSKTEDRKRRKQDKTKELQRTVALAGCFVGMSNREIQRMTGLSARMVTNRLAEVLSLDPVIEARERMESYLPLAIQRAIERIEAGDNDLLRDLLKGAGVFQSYHQIRDRSQEATEDQLRASAKELLLKELRAGAVAVRYTKSPETRTATNASAGNVEHGRETSESGQPAAIETEAQDAGDAPDLADTYARPPEADPPAPVTPLPPPVENQLPVSNFTGFLGDGERGAVGGNESAVGIDSGEVQGGMAESYDSGAVSDMSSERRLLYEELIGFSEGDDAEGS